MSADGRAPALADSLHLESRNTCGEHSAGRLPDMRQRRNKRVRKAVNFYKVCYQFREPFKARTRLQDASL